MGEQDWVKELKDELAHIPDTAAVEKERWAKRCIYKVPASIKDLNKKAYVPQRVSFGPYHHGVEHLLPMEEHKRRALLHFLKRSNKPLEVLVNSLAQVVQDLKDSYDSLDVANWQGDTNSFLRMMVLDGCFMLDVLRMGSASWDNDYYAHNDPIFSDHGRLYIVPYIRRDMVLLENQLPMLVLYKLQAAVEHPVESEEEYVNSLIFFCSRVVPNQNMYKEKYLHILDGFRKGLIWIKSGQHDEHNNVYKYFGSVKRVMRSATGLDEAGIRFKRSKTSCLNDISFKSGVLMLPCIVVNDSFETLILNSMAFERIRYGAGNKMTSYICFMSKLINSARDVSLLQSRGIILNNAIGSENAVVELFHSLSKDIMIHPHSNLDLVHCDVNEYCERRWNVWRANIIGAYHMSTQWSPWAYWSIIAAVLLFVLSVFQCAYTIYPYYHPNKP